MNSKPKCILITGPPASGKTTLAEELGKKMRLPVISRDEIKAGYINTIGVKHDQLPPNTNQIVSDHFFKIVCQYLNCHISIIIEAAFQHQVWQPRMSEILELSNPYIIICTIDDETAAKRRLRRALADPGREYYHGDKCVSVYQETGKVMPLSNYVAPDFNLPTIHVLTEAEYAPSLNQIIHQIQSSLTSKNQVDHR